MPCETLHGFCPGRDAEAVARLGETCILSRVPWRCPACRTVIQHNPFEDRPRTGEVYRCHVCRLSLELHTASDKLIVAPLDFDNGIDPSANLKRDKPTPSRPRRRRQTKA